MASLHKLTKSDFDHRGRRCCQRHPKHRQSPGVCSLCLTEKLSRILSATASSREASDSLSSSYSSCSSSYYSSASSCSSPDRPSNKAGFVFSAIFKKSRSIAFGRRLGRGIESEKKSKLGFWSRFSSRPRKKGMELDKVLMRSTTVVLHTNVHG